MGIKSKLYSYEAVKALKETLRPLKHALCGKTGMYKTLDEVIALEGSRESVKIVFDIGAAAGEKAITFLRTFPNATVYCFEPLSSSFERLLKRTKRFGNRIRPYNFGFFNENTTRSMNIMSYADASSLFRLPKEFGRSGIREIRQEMVSLRRLDDFVADEGLRKIDLVKIDVEGAEKEVLEGGLQSLGKVVDNVIVEILFVHRPKEDYDAIFQYFSRAGFHLISKHEDYFFSKSPPTRFS